jgi:hypothetical protein
MRELNRFVHYYTRFRNHEYSQKLEEPLLNNVRQKMELLASSLSKGQKGEGRSPLVMKHEVVSKSYKNAPITMPLIILQLF